MKKILLLGIFIPFMAFSQIHNNKKKETIDLNLEFERSVDIEIPSKIDESFKQLSAYDDFSCQFECSDNSINDLFTRFYFKINKIEKKLIITTHTENFCSKEMKGLVKYIEIFELPINKIEDSPISTENIQTSNNGKHIWGEYTRFHIYSKYNSKSFKEIAHRERRSYRNKENTLVSKDTTMVDNVIFYLPKKVADRVKVSLNEIIKMW